MINTKSSLALNKFLWPAIAWTLLITVACLVSTDSLSDISKFDFEHKDKIVHFGFYFVFTFFWYLFFTSGTLAGNKKAAVLVFIFAVVYGVLVEVCQGLFTSERSAEIMDAVANTSGSATAILAIWLFRKIKK